ncbi:MAG: hypothetical protein KBC30_11535 [Planctomycetes bacterium]|nr:hypothetical protein [Planctomycetota bacterium]
MLWGGNLALLWGGNLARGRESCSALGRESCSGEGILLWGCCSGEKLLWRVLE